MQKGEVHVSYDEWRNMAEEKTENRGGVGSQIDVSTIKRGGKHVPGKTVDSIKHTDNKEKRRRRRRGGQEKKSTTLLVSITCQQEPQSLNSRGQLLALGHIMPPLNNTSTC